MIEKIESFLTPHLLRVFPPLKERGPEVASSAIEMILVNLVVLIGVVLGQWDVFFLMIIYWLETFSSGLFTWIRLFVGALYSAGRPKPATWFLAVFHSGFFTIHFGAFMSAHLFITLALIWVGVHGAGVSSDIAPFFREYFAAEEVESFADVFTLIILDYKLELAALIALVYRQGHSFLNSYWSKKDSLDYDVETVMMAPYNRVIHMHVSLIFGGFIVMGAMNFNLPVASTGMAIVWVFAKIWIELKTLVKEGA